MFSPNHTRDPRGIALAGEKITFKFEAAHSGGSTLPSGKATRHFLLDNPRAL
jgi:hypothetical protein